MSEKKILNAMTIDVEDYFMVSAFEHFVDKSSWGKQASRVVANTTKVMDILDEYQTKGTFFVVGWVAEQFPDLIRDIHRRGHEIGCHSYFHQLLYDLGPEKFRDDIRKTKTVIEKVIQEPIVGYRAPSFSLTQESSWAFDILKEEGFVYDSSLMPAPHSRGGWNGKNAQRFPYRHGELYEFPMSTLQFCGKTLPFSGGGYFRLFPYGVTKRGLLSCHKAGQPAVVYLHPWEFDPDQPKMPVKGVSRFKHYVNLGKTEKKFRQLLSDFRFGTTRDVLKETVGMN